MKIERFINNFWRLGPQGPPMGDQKLPGIFFDFPPEPQRRPKRPDPIRSGLLGPRRGQSKVWGLSWGKSAYGDPAARLAP